MMMLFSDKSVESPRGRRKNSPPSSVRSGSPRFFAWALYDAADQAFPTLIHTFVFSVYFTQMVAEDPTTGTAQWGSTVSLAGLVVAIAAPILGAVADQGGRRKPWIAVFTCLCISATALLWFVKPSAEYALLALLLVGLGTIGSELALVFYNSMLPRLAPPERLGRWSGWSWGLGYAGGLASLTTALLVLVAPQGALLGLDAQSSEHVRAVAPFAALWYLVFAWPLFLLAPDVAGSGKQAGQMVRDGLRQLRRTIREVQRYGPMVRFLAAHMIYVDGLATLFAFGGIYAAGTFGLSSETVLLFGIALHIAASAGAASFAWIDDRIGSKATILISLLGLMIPGTIILFVESTVLFWTFGLALGLFVGPAQAASRSQLAHMAPKQMQNEMFGLYALSGKATAFLGPVLVGWLTFWAGSQRIGMGVIIVFFAVGFLIMLTVPGRGATGEPRPTND